MEHLGADERFSTSRKKLIESHGISKGFQQNEGKEVSIGSKKIEGQ